MEDPMITNQAMKLSPRKLGDQWEDWSGQIEENNGDLDTDAWWFLAAWGITSALSMLCIGTFLYLISPRLTEISDWFNIFAQLIGIALILTIFTIYLLVLLTYFSGKPFAFFLKNKELANYPLAKWSLAMGAKFGISKDRLSNSLMKVSNRVVRSLYGKIEPEELLIVVPRCLSKFMRTELDDLTKRYGVTFYTASGGNAARKLLEEKKPKGIIAVACERDLLSGIQDVGGRYPVIAIANKRPEGPCINTHFSLEEMESAICHFLKPATSNRRLYG